jgi:AraC-like DNA-binding protein
MSDDPFSDILKLTSAECVASGSLNAGGQWAIRFPAPGKVKFFGVVRGNCWLSMEGEQGPGRIEVGDVVLLSAQRSFVLASDLSASPIEAESLLTGEDNVTIKLGDGIDCSLIGGHVQLDPASGRFFADILPSWIHVRRTSSQSITLQWLLDQIMRERAASLPGSTLALAQMVQLIFIQALRAHLETARTSRVGWLRAISDRRLAPSLRLMHTDPGRAWQLEELAEAAAMSRTTFALHFKTAAGITPLAYLTEWRMRLAQRALREEDTQVSALARSLGYASESAFSNAFKRVTGHAPKSYRKAFRTNTHPGHGRGDPIT